MRYRGTIVAAMALSMLPAMACAPGDSPAAGNSSEAGRPLGDVYTLPVPLLTDAGLVVAPNGDDAAAGGPSDPLRTLHEAGRRAEPGTTITVRDGTYTGDITTEASGTESARIAYVAESPTVRIIGTDSQDGVWENNGDHVDIVGFDISGPNDNGIYNRGSQVRIMRNRVHDIPGNCIYTQNDDYSLSDIDVLANVTFDCGSDELDHGIYVTHRRGVVANNISYSGTGFGIHCWHACNAVVVINNLVFDNDEGGIVIGGENGDDGGADNSLVANNIAVDNGREGIREGGESGPNNRFVNNLLWGNDRDWILIQTGDEQGTIVADPRFADFPVDGSGNYPLAPSSPAVDAGTPEWAPPVAIDWAPRPQSDGFDLGPHEQ